MAVGIIILNYNNAVDTVHCIDSIETHNTAPIKFILVDNGSREEHIRSLDTYIQSRFRDDCLRTSPDQETGRLPKMTFLLNPENSGYARGNNLGLALAARDEEITHILLLNNDILFVEDILPKLLEDAQRLDHCGIITPLLVRKDLVTVDYCVAKRFISNWNIMVPFLLHNRNWHGWISKNAEKQLAWTRCPELLETGESFPIDYSSGSCLFSPKSVLLEIEGLDPGTFLYYEEIILYKRLKKAGYQNYCDPGIRIVHLGGSSTRMSDNAFLQRCNLESADLYFRKYGDCTLAQRIVWALTKASWKLRLLYKNKKKSL